MQALSMIEMAASPTESMTPAQAAEPNRQEFGQVLSAQQRPEKQQVAMTKCGTENKSQTAAPADQPAENSGQTEKSMLNKNTAEQARERNRQSKEGLPEQLLAKRAACEDQVICRDGADPEILQLLVNLLETLGKVKNQGHGEDSGEIGKFLQQPSEQLDHEEISAAELPVTPAAADLAPVRSIKPDTSDMLAEVTAKLDVSQPLEMVAADLVPQNDSILQNELEVEDSQLQPLIKELASQLAAALSAQDEAQAAEPKAAIATETPVPLATMEQQLEQAITAILADNKSQEQVQVPLETGVQEVAASLTKVRQALQQALRMLSQQSNTLVTETETQKLTGEGPTEVQNLIVAEEAAKQVDPRFAGLLKPRPENGLPQQRQPLHLHEHQRRTDSSHSQVPGAQVATPQPVQEASGEPPKFAELVDLFKGTSPKQASDNLLQQVQGPNATQGQDTAAKPLMSTAPVVQLANGQQVAESQIFDQVVARFTSSFNGESGRMVLRLQPAELGSLRIELKVEGDQIRANIQAHSQQVQDVLERHLPQLRSALAEQGLKIEQFQVDVNREQEQRGGFDNLAQHDSQQRGNKSEPRWRRIAEPEEQIVPLAHLLQNGGGGISLHV